MSRAVAKRREPGRPMEHWKILNSRYLLRRWWMNLREDHVRLPGGMELEEFHVVEYPDWAAVVCLTEEGKLVMVEQYRHGVQRPSLELPAGAVEAGEAPLEGARRELLEETGYAAERWITLGTCAPEPSKHTNYAHFFVARGARRVRAPQPDAAEHLTVHLVEPAELLERAEGGELLHGIHLAALFWASRRGLLPMRQ